MRHPQSPSHPTGQGALPRAGATATSWMSVAPPLPCRLSPATQRQSRARAAPPPATERSARRVQPSHRRSPPAMASSSPPLADPDDRVPCSSVHTAYLFGRLTNQWCHCRVFSVKQLALTPNIVMIVRCYDESNESDDAFSADGQPHPPVVAAERFRSPSAPQPHLTGGPCQGHRTVETDDLGSHRYVRAAGTGSP